MLGALIGVGLLLFGGCEEERKKSQADVSTNEELLLAYQAQAEERVRALCCSVNGVGSVQAVIVTLERGFESEYAVEYANGTEKYVLIGSGNSETGLLLSSSPPRIRGIGVVCTGAESAEVRRELTLLLCSAFDLASHHVYIAKAQK